MKKLIHNLIYFSFPEKRALILFFMVVMTLHGGQIIYNHMLPVETYDLSLYNGFFEIKPANLGEEIMVDSLSAVNSHLDYKRKKEVRKSKMSAKRMPENSIPLEVVQVASEKEIPTFETSNYNNSDSIIIDPKKKTIKVEVNTAEEYELQYINGIGPAFASRIIKYRDLLGGFYHINQLKEVYGIDDEKFEQIKNQIEIIGKVKKLPLDQPNPPFFKHPYLTPLEAKIIRAYILQHGPIKMPNDLLNIKIVTKETVDKIKPYLPE